MRLCELKEKEVINSCDCKRLGFVCDVEFDERTGCIHALIVPGCGRIFGILGRDTEYVIPYSCICQIGPDIILVKVREEDVLVKCRE